MKHVKFDMHVHTAEGSPDSSGGIREYIEILKNKGFGGMMVTDHNSYKGHDSLKEYDIDPNSDFIILKGIEYDTLSSGHMLIVMPEGPIPKGLYHRGLPLKSVIRLVHENGGIIGPAHMCGEPFLSFYSTGFWFKSPSKKRNLIEQFDFIEGYNACENDDNNLHARMIAGIYDKPMTGGSDAHRNDAVGLGYTLLPENVRTQQDFIDLIRSGQKLRIGGHFYGKSTKEKLGRANHLLVYGFFYYNKALNLAKQTQRFLKRTKNSDLEG